VSLVNDPNSQVGKVEVLTPIQINTTIPSWNQGVLDVPGLTFDYGLHKFVFRFQVCTVLLAVLACLLFVLLHNINKGIR
jgi:hypothetical protein